MKVVSYQRIDALNVEVRLECGHRQRELALIGCQILKVECCLGCQSETTYIKQVSARLPPCDSIHPVEAFIRNLYLEGFSVDDAIAYLRCMEEFNPSLDEDIALARMEKIQAKYDKKTGKVGVPK